jgi:dihydroxy-acid dehydratase
VFEAVGQFSAGKMSEEDFCEIERRAIPGSGSCGGMYTANTMSSVRGAGHEPALLVDHGQRPTTRRSSVGPAAKVLVEAVKNDLKPRDIVTKQGDRERRGRDHGHRRLDQRGAALPGHRPRGRRRMDHRRLRARAPQGAGAVRPEAQRPYLAIDLHRAGGIPQVMKMLLNAGLLHGDCMTITGQTVAEELADVPDRRAPTRT